MAKTVVEFVRMDALFSDEEIERLRKEAEKIHNWVPENLLLLTEINSRLQTTAGRCRLKRVLEESCEYTIFGRIELNPDYYKQFGFERTVGTFLHEIAHAVQAALTGRTGHDRFFRSICHALGGTMNTKMAGAVYKDSGTKEYIKTEWKYLYVCPCGKGSKKYKRKPQRKMLFRLHCPECKLPMAHFNAIDL